MQSVNKKIFVMMFLGIFLISLVSALTFGQNTEFNISIVCINAGFCSSSGFCNASIFAPDGFVILSGVQAGQSANLAVHNITLNSTQTTQLGQYSVGGFCKDGSVTQLIDFNFDVTADGKPFEAFPNQFAVIALGFLLIVTGLVKDRFRMLKFMGSFILMVMGVLTLFPGYNFINWTTLFGVALGTTIFAIGFWFLIEDSFSRTSQEERFDQDQGEQEEDLNK